MRQKGFYTQILDLQKAIKSGEFSNWSHNKKQYTIAKLYRQRAGLQSRGIKVAFSCGVFLLFASTLMAQTGQCSLAGIGDLATPTTSDTLRIPAIGDADSDGDDDLTVLEIDFATDDVNFRYFELEGGSYTELFGVDNPFVDFQTVFDGLLGPNQDPIFYPEFKDVDGDGDMDLVLGFKRNDQEEGLFVIYNDGGFSIDNEPFLLFDGSVTDFVSGLIYPVRFCNLDSDCEEEFIVFDQCDNSSGIFAFDFNGSTWEFDADLSDQFDVFEARADKDFIFFDNNGDCLDDLVLISMKEQAPTLEGTYYENTSQGAFIEGPLPFTPPPFFFTECNVFNTYPHFTTGDLYANNEVDVIGSGLINPMTRSLDCINTAVPPECESCLKPIPTLGQWSLIVLSIFLSILGILGIKQSESKVSEDKTAF